MRLISPPEPDAKIPKGCMATRLTDDHWVLHRMTWTERASDFFIARCQWPGVLGGWMYRVGNWLTRIAYYRSLVPDSRESHPKEVEE